MEILIKCQEMVHSCHCEAGRGVSENALQFVRYTKKNRSCPGTRGELSGRTEGKGLEEATEDWTDEGQTTGHRCTQH